MAAEEGQWEHAFPPLGENCREVDRPSAVTAVSAWNATLRMASCARSLPAESYFCNRRTGVNWPCPIFDQMLTCFSEITEGGHKPHR